MALTSLVVCADAKALQVLSQVLLGLGIGVECCGDSPAAADLLVAQPFDAVLVDCEDKHAARELIAVARKTPGNEATIIIAMVDKPSQVRELLASGANFILYKPISAERAGSSLRAARGLMRREKRRKPRIALHAQVSIDYAGTENASATLLDLSEDGLAIQSECKLPHHCQVYFKFNLPGRQSMLRLSGEVVWQDASGRVGTRFAHVPQTSRRVLNEWIKANLPRPREANENSRLASQQPGAKPPANLSAATRLRSLSSSNRRVQTRHACRLGADVYRAGSTVPNRCSLSDISAGGCYVQTTEPFPAGVAVNIVVRVRDMKLSVRGTVQAMHPGFGMGVKFALKTVEEQEQVQQLIACQVPGPESSV
jgi:CheY-like chemotaxis protein